jgi:hypothetical protein
MTSASSARQFDLSTEARIFPTASVPDIVKISKTTDDFSKGDLVMYFSRGASLCMSRSQDKGITWSSPTAVEFSGNQANGGAVDPSIIQLANGRLRLFYYGPKNSNGDPAQIPGIHHIYSASGADGIHFTIEAGKRFSAASITDPEVIQFNGVWWMYLSHGSETLIARSATGRTFKYTGKIWSGGGIPGVYVHDGRVDIFGCSGGDIMTARSRNAKDFGTAAVALAGNGETICDPSPVRLNRSTFLLFYKMIVDNS